MTKKTVRLRHLFLALAFSFTALLSQAQGPGDPGDDPDPAIPFDGGISLVVAAGIAYAAKKGHDKRKQANKQEHAE